MTPEERAIQICPQPDNHVYGNVDAMSKCCEACEPIAAAILDAVKAEREACAEMLLSMGGHLNSCTQRFPEGSPELTRCIAFAVAAHGFAARIRARQCSQSAVTMTGAIRPAGVPLSP